MGVESTVSNPDAVAQVASFALVIPDSAFISAFSMEIDGEKYEARVEEKEEAEKAFEKALSTGRGAGLVSQDAKDANKFTVSTNIEGEQEVVFRLTYDELLGRKESMYRQEINIDPRQIVDDFRVEVYINESLPITEISVPELLESTTIDPSEETQNSFVKIEKNFEGDAKKAKIVFAPAAAAYHPQLFKSGSPQAYTPHSRIVSGPRSPPVLAPEPIMAYDDTGFESFSYSTFDYGVYADDYDYPTSRGGPPPISATRGPTAAYTSTTTSTSTTSSSSTTTKPETCQLTLFSKTYNRGEEWTLQDDSADLGSFSDIAISATLEGSCCWQLFGEVNFAGPTTWLRPGGVYRGTDSFGRQLFQDVSSVKRVQC